MVKVKDDWGEASDCDNGDRCAYCHSRMELQFHPDVSPLLSVLFLCSLYFSSSTSLSFALMSNQCHLNSFYHWLTSEAIQCACVVLHQIKWLKACLAVQ